MVWLHGESTAGVSFLLQSRPWTIELPHTLLTATAPLALLPASSSTRLLVQPLLAGPVGLGWQPSKIQRLRSFQINHVMRITSEFSPFLAVFGAPRTAHRRQPWNTFGSCDVARNVWWTLVCKLLYEGFIVLYNGQTYFMLFQNVDVSSCSFSLAV